MSKLIEQLEAKISSNQEKLAKLRRKAEKAKSQVEAATLEGTTRPETSEVMQARLVKLAAKVSKIDNAIKTTESNLKAFEEALEKARS